MTKLKFYFAFFNPHFFIIFMRRLQKDKGLQQHVELSKPKGVVDRIRNVISENYGFTLHVSTFYSSNPLSSLLVYPKYPLSIESSSFES